MGRTSREIEREIRFERKRWFQLIRKGNIEMALLLDTRIRQLEQEALACDWIHSICAKEKNYGGANKRSE